ncbi:hypothetical protein [Actinopolymorpha alba]|uniref:hypothetical protein n=1 Tax=Actinopolymorpha alba TaxID=533267 RepID=UPI000363DD76|nr:hypothetical protein [Actinopolymorpha alba]
MRASVAARGRSLQPVERGAVGDAASVEVDDARRADSDRERSLSSQGWSLQQLGHGTADGPEPTCPAQVGAEHAPGAFHDRPGEVGSHDLQPTGADIDTEDEPGLRTEPNPSTRAPAPAGPGLLLGRDLGNQPAP